MYIIKIQSLSWHLSFQNLSYSGTVCQISIYAYWFIYDLPYNPRFIQELLANYALTFPYIIHTSFGTNWNFSVTTAPKFGASVSHVVVGRYP